MYRVRGRVLFGFLLLSLGLGLVLAEMPGWVGHPLSPPLHESLPMLFAYVLLPLFLVWPMRRSGQSLAGLLGARPDRKRVGWGVGTGLAMVAIAFASIYVVFLPLSYIRPDWVRWWLFEPPVTIVWTQGDYRGIANASNFVLIVLLGPVVEELLFRGLLLRAWSLRLGRAWALVLSSLCFAIFHMDLLGAFVFGLVTGFVFLKTRALWIPIVIHVSNNGVAWLLAVIAVLVDAGPSTLESFQQWWWTGVVGAAVGIPALALLLRRTPAVATSSWRPPPAPVSASRP